MLKVPPVPFRGRRLPPRQLGGTSQLTLVSATYNSATEELTLVFDRPVSIAAVVPEQITVIDPVFNSSSYEANGATLTGPATVRLSLNQLGAASGSVVRMSASAQTGIVAADDGAAWPGVTDLPLPYP